MKKKNSSRNKRSSRQNRTKRKSINKNRTKRNSKRVSRSKKREYTGGGNIITILDVLLSKDVINILPTSQIFDYKKVDRYLNMIDVDNLKDIVLSNNYYRKSPTIQSIFKYTAEELQDPNKIKFEIENVNCQDLINDRNMNVKQLFLYLFECNKDLFIKEDVNWYKVCLGLEELDETFEYNVMKNLVDMGVFIKNSEIKEKTKVLEENLDFKLIMKKRLHSCSNKPQGIFDSLFGKVSFKSFNNCDKNNKKGVLYLYDEYQRFLTKESNDNLSKLDKVKILIYCETRQHLLSKYLSLEMVRLNDKRFSKIKNILNNIYKLDKNIIKENDKKLKEFKKSTEDKNIIKNELKKVEDKVREPVSQEKSEEEKIMDELAERRKKSEDENNKFNINNQEIDDKINFKDNIEGGGEELFGSTDDIDESPQEPSPYIESPPEPSPDIESPPESTSNLVFEQEPNPEPESDNLYDFDEDKDYLGATPADSKTDDDTFDLFDTSDIPSKSDSIELQSSEPLISESYLNENSINDNFENENNLKNENSMNDKYKIDKDLDVPEIIVPDAEERVKTHEIYTGCKDMQKRFHNDKIILESDLTKLDGCEKLGLEPFIPPL